MASPRSATDETRAGRRSSGSGRLADGVRPPRALPRRGVDDLAERREADGAGDRLAVVLEGGHAAEERNSPNERHGAVDGVEVPAVAGCAVLLAVFLAEDGVGGALGVENATR